MSLQIETTCEMITATGAGKAQEPRHKDGVLIAPPARWQPINARELWKYRELMYFLVWRDVKVRYKQTALGALWAVLQPAMMMIVFTVFLGRMANMDQGIKNYPLFTYLALVPWTFFSTAVSNAGNSVVGSERLVSKIYFPRLAIPFAAAGASFVDFCIAFTLLLVMLVGYRVMPTAQILVMPVILALIGIMALGVGTLLAALNVAYRDFKYVMPFMMQIWMYATPTIYQEPKANGGLLYTLIMINPMTNLIGAFRASCIGGVIDWPRVMMAGAMGVVMLMVGCVVFRRMERNFADLI